MTERYLDYLEYFLKKDRTALMQMLDEEDFEDEVKEFLYAKNICPESGCFNEMRDISRDELLTNDPYDIFESFSIGLECDTCGHRHYFE